LPGTGRPPSAGVSASPRSARASGSASDLAGRRRSARLIRNTSFSSGADDTGGLAPEPVIGVFPSVPSFLRLTICYLIEHSEDWANERSYIREEKAQGSLDKLHELMAQAAN
jgi:hypothetical protein